MGAQVLGSAAKENPEVEHKRLEVQISSSDGLQHLLQTIHEYFRR